MASSYSCPVQPRYQVFMSFRGEDTRHSFTSHLLKALKEHGIRVFFDEETLEKGEELTPALLNAIAASNISIVVLSEDYASSKSCLGELSKIMECKLSQAQIVLPIFYRVNPSHVRHPNQDESPFKESFHQHLMNKPEEAERWKAAFTQVGYLKGWHMDGGNSDRSEPEYIKSIVEDVIKKLGCKSTSVSEELVGIKEHIERMLLLIDQEDIRVIGIWGMGGIGKTTLAEAIYNWILSDSKFSAYHFLLNVREKLDKNGMQSLRSELLSKLLIKEDTKIDTPMIGSKVIQDRLHNIRAFVVLDDVSNCDQVDGLGVEHFGPGSKIIVTSRDRQTLVNIGVDKLYKLEEFNEDDSLKLFCNFAFKKYDPIADFRDLSMKFLSYAKGQPLALKVLGAALYQKDRDVWESALEKLKEYPEKDIFGPLNISFDGLEILQRDLFLDIACLFSEEWNDKDNVIKLLKDCYSGAWFGISKLVDKCLVDLRSGYPWMHDLLQEMGRDIVRQESEDPSKRSRLWSPKDVYQVLKNNKGTKLIKGISVDTSQLEALQIRPAIFRKMVNLVFIRFYCKDISCNKLFLANEDLNYLPDGLRSLCWDCYPLKSLPSNFNSHKIVELRFAHSNIEQLWDGDQDFVNLRKMDLSGCKNMQKIPNLLRATKLENLSCDGCISLTELPCMMHLTSLKQLRVSNCKSLKSLSRLPQWLVIIDASDCGSLERVSFIFEQDHIMPRVQSLKVLNVRDCNSLVSLSGLSPCLDKIFATNCTSLQSVSFTDDDYQPQFSHMQDFAFNNCFNLNQGVRDNMFATCITKKLQSRVKQLIYKRLKEESQQVLSKSKIVDRSVRSDEVLYYIPGSEIFDKFENQSRNSSITVKLAASATSRRFLCVALCLVFDYKHSGEVNICYYAIDCNYQLEDADGVHQNFRGRWFVEYRKPIRIGCSNEHVFVLFRDDMVHIDMNYKQASFDFKVACNYYDDKLRYLKGEERKVEKCGVHVFYVDAESFTVSEATGSSINFSSEEGNTSCSPSIISPNSASPILHSVARLTIEEDANVGNGHGLKALLLQYLET